MKNKQLLAEYLTLWGEIHDKKISETMANFYFETLKPFSDSDCEKVFKKVGLKWFPKPQDFLDELQGNKKDQATLAWLKVDKAVKSHGPYASVKFDDPAIHGVIEAMGGWPQFQDCSLKNDWKWKRKEFEELYPIMEKKDDNPIYLHGQCEKESIAMGFNIQYKIELVGDSGIISQLKEA